MSVDIGKISVTFAASTEGFDRGVGSATKSLQDFAQKAATAGATLKGDFAASFGDSIGALSEKLKTATLSSAAFGASVSAAFGKAAKAIDSGATGSFDVLAKQMELGIATSKDFAESFGEISGRARDAINSVAQEGFRELDAQLKAGKLSADDFTDSVVSIAAGEAGAGIENTRNSVAALDAALRNGAVTGEEFLAMQKEISSDSASESAARQAEALQRVREQLDGGKIDADQFAGGLASINSSFRFEAFAEYESQMASVAAANKSGAVSMEEFEAEHKRLTAVLQQRVTEDLERGVTELNNAHRDGKITADDFADAQERLNAQIVAGNAAVARAAKAAAPAAGGGGHGGGHGAGGGIMAGLESVGQVTALVPGEIGHVGHTMENVVHVAHAAQNAIAGLGPEFAALAGPVGIAAAALTVAGGAVMHLVSEFAEAAREAKKLGAQFGLTLREVSELQTVLSHVGSSTAEFQRVARTLSQSLSHATDGSASASAAFRRLGIDAKEIRFEAASKQVEEVVVALAKIENPAERSMLAVKLLGKTGAEFAAKFGTDLKAIEEKFEHARQAVEKFKTAFSDFDAGQLVEAGADIESIKHATEGLGATVAAAFAPLMSGLASGLADIIGAITNVITPLVPLFQIVGAAIGETLRVIGSAVNSLARIFSAGFANIITGAEALFKALTGGVGIVESIQGIGSVLVEGMNAIATAAEKVRDNFEAWTLGKTVEEIEQAKRKTQEMAALGEAAAKIQEKYGDKTELIREKIEEIKKLRETMGGDGKPLISATEAASALNDLNKQLKEASPHIKMMTTEGENFKKTMEKAKEDAQGMGNNIATEGFAKYRAAYADLLKQLGSNKITKELFDKSVEGLADKFNKEMGRAKPIKAISDQIADLVKKSTQATAGAAVAADFQKFDRAQLAGGVGFNDKANARIQRMDDFAGELGLTLKPKLEGLDLYRQRMDEINKVAVEVAKGQGLVIEEERKLAELRKAAVKDLLDSIKKSVGSIGERQKGPAEKAVDDLGTLGKAAADARKAMEDAAANGDRKGFNEAQAQYKDIQDRQQRVVGGIAGQNKYEGSGEKAVREYDQKIADIDAAMKNAQGAETIFALRDAKENAAKQFQMENLDVLDMAASGGRADKRAATGVDANSQEGASTYFRIMREDGSITKRQLEEARQMRILLQKIRDNTANQLQAANVGQ